MPPKRGRDLSVLRRLVPFVRGHVGVVAASIMLLPLLAGVQLAQPYLIRIAIDDYLTPGQFDWPEIGALTALYVAAQLIAAGAFLALFRFKINMLWTLAGAAGVGLVYFLLAG